MGIQLGFLDYAPNGIRTHIFPFGGQVLYPVELQGRILASK